MTFRVERQCRCGGSVTVQTDSMYTAIELDAAFLRLHDGDGHGAALAVGAASARRAERTGEDQ